MEYLEDFLSTYESRNMSEQTIKAYRSDITNFYKWIGKGTLDITGLDVQRYVNLRTKEHKAEKTRCRFLAALKMYYKWCLKHKLVKENPVEEVDAPKIPHRLPKFLTEEELRLVLDNAPNFRLKTIMYVMYSTAARISEVCNLDKNDFDFIHGTVNIKHGKGNKQRIVYLTDEARQTLEEYWSTRQDSNPAAFIGRTKERVCVSEIQKEIREYGKTLNLGKKLHAHLFRKSLASHMVQRGADILVVSKILGHADVSTTSQCYASLTDEVQHNAFDKLINRKEGSADGLNTAI